MRKWPTPHLTVGLPGVGRTTLARRIAGDESILRLTPDEWMAPLGTVFFGALRGRTDRAFSASLEVPAVLLAGLAALSLLLPRERARVRQ